MLITRETRPDDCQQKIEFKMKTLNFHTIFAHTSGTMTKQYYH
jgi:hypothetical protein